MASTKLKLLKHYKCIIEVTAKALRLKCSGKGFAVMDYIFQIIWSS